jgi:hypothetical protein
MNPAIHQPPFIKLWNGFSLDGYFRPYWSEWDAVAVDNLNGIADLAGCLEPRFYRAPNTGNDQVQPFNYLSYALSLMPGSFIIGFAHAPEVYAGAAEAEILLSTEDGLLFIAAVAGTGGNAITVFIPTPGPSQTLSVGVVGTAITITLGSDANSNVTSTIAQVVAAVIASAAASALVIAEVVGDQTAFSPTTPGGAVSLAGGGLLQSQINYQVQVTDMQLDHKFFSSPLRDDYLSGRPSILEVPFPVVVPGNFLVEFWNASQSLPVTAQLIFIVAEPVREDLLNHPRRS